MLKEVFVEGVVVHLVRVPESCKEGRDRGRIGSLGIVDEELL